MIAPYARNGFAVDLQRGGTVEFHLDIVTSQHGYHLVMLYMLALENAGKNGQRFELAGAVHQHHRKRAVMVQPILRRRYLHAADVIAAVHGGREPYMLEALRFAVHRDSCTDRVIPKQQPLDGDGGVVYVFLALGALNIATSQQ